MGSGVTMFDFVAKHPHRRCENARENLCKEACLVWVCKRGPAGAHAQLSPTPGPAPPTPTHGHHLPKQWPPCHLVHVADLLCLTCHQ